MKLLVIRHGAAEDSAPGGDAERSLTHEGKKEMKEIARGLAKLVDSIDIIGASPLLRAQQTAKIVAKEFNDVEIETVSALVPGSDLNDLLTWIAGHKSEDLVTVVGHEPLLGLLVTWLMTGAQSSRVEMTKGGAALLEFNSRVASGAASLHRLLTGHDLKRIAH